MTINYIQIKYITILAFVALNWNVFLQSNINNQCFTSVKALILSQFL